MYNILFTDKAEKDIKKLNKQDRKRIIEKLKEYSYNPLSYAIKLSNAKIGSFRFRIGDYRVIFDIDGNTLVILRLGHRKNIY